VLTVNAYVVNVGIEIGGAARLASVRSGGEDARVEHDWAAVSRALTERLDERGTTQTELAATAQVSLTTVRELVHNLNARRRHPRTLTALSAALGWPESHLDDVLRGRSTAGSGLPPGDPVLEELRAMRSQLLAMQEEIATVRERTADLGPIRETLERITARLAALEGV
jgi:hypothetical protein